MKNVSDTSCGENQNFSNFFFHAIYEIMWKNIVEQGRSQMTLWHIRIACWIPKATNTYSEYVIVNGFPLQQWLHKRA
jgi:hypothetical protein